MTQWGISTGKQVGLRTGGETPSIASLFLLSTAYEAYLDHLGYTRSCCAIHSIISPEPRTILFTMQRNDGVFILINLRTIEKYIEEWISPDPDAIMAQELFGENTWVMTSPEDDNEMIIFDPVMLNIYTPEDMHDLIEGEDLMRGLDEMNETEFVL